MTVFRGRSATSDDAGFEAAVLGRLFNGWRPADRRPRAVLFAADEAGVQEGVRHAAARWITGVHPRSADSPFCRMRRPTKRRVLVRPPTVPGAR